MELRVLELKLSSVLVVVVVALAAVTCRLTSPLTHSAAPLVACGVDAAAYPIASHCRVTSTLDLEGEKRERDEGKQN
jgi:hypothetical protein